MNVWLICVSMTSGSKIFFQRCKQLLDDETSVNCFRKTSLQYHNINMRFFLGPPELAGWRQLTFKRVRAHTNTQQVAGCEIATEASDKLKQDLLIKSTVDILMLPMVLWKSRARVKCFGVMRKNRMNTLLSGTYESITPWLAGLPVGNDHRFFNLTKHLKIFPETWIRGVVGKSPDKNLRICRVLLRGVHR